MFFCLVFLFCLIIIACPIRSFLPKKEHLHRGVGLHLSRVTDGSGSMSTSPTTFREAGPPPDLPSMLLSNRIVYLGLPVAPKVAEVIIAQLLLLDHESSTSPITLYINSTEFDNSDAPNLLGETMQVLGIVDALRYVKPPIHTACVGLAEGAAALLLAAGDVGHRYALPNASIVLKTPSGGIPYAQGTTLVGAAKEILTVRDEYVQLLSKFTGKSENEVSQDLLRTKYLTAEEAVKYGIVDKVVHGTKEKSRDL